MGLTKAGMIGVRYVLVSACVCAAVHTGTHAYIHREKPQVGAASTEGRKDIL